MMRVAGRKRGDVCWLLTRLVLEARGTVEGGSDAKVDKAKGRPSERDGEVDDKGGKRLKRNSVEEMKIPFGFLLCFGVWALMTSARSDTRYSSRSGLDFYS